MDNFVYLDRVLLHCSLQIPVLASDLGYFDNPALSTDPLRGLLQQDRSWTVDEMLSSPSLDTALRHHLRHSLQLLRHLRHNQTLLNTILGETLESLFPGALQDLVFARDLGHFEHLVLLTKPFRTALRMESLLHSFL